MKVVILIMAFAFGLNVQAKGPAVLGASDFVAPSIYDYETLGNDFGVGSIVYDQKNNEFYGREGQTGGWINLSDVTRQFAVEVNSTCTSSPCAIDREFGGDWVNTITRSGTGAYSVNFTASLFTTPPVCTVTSLNASTPDICKLNSTPTTSAASVHCYSLTSSPTFIDGRFSLMCITE